MTDRERSLEYSMNPLRPPHSPMCATCRYYHQHYIQCGAQYAPIYTGHCTEPRCKIRKPSDLCDRYEPKEEQP